MLKLHALHYRISVGSACWDTWMATIWKIMLKISPSLGTNGIFVLQLDVYLLEYF